MSSGLKVCEGSAVMEMGPTPQSQAGGDEEAVFYNKVQVLNRDLSIQVIRLYSEMREREKQERYRSKVARYEEMVRQQASGQLSAQTNVKPPYEPQKGIRILDALAATGLRSVRYLKEIPLASHVTINDLEEVATTQARSNCEKNNVDMSKVAINTGDAVDFMYAHRKPLDNFDVIDLDPYGTVSPFLDSAVQAVADGGLMCVTCTDMAVLCGSFPEKCYALYGSVPLKNAYVHENALRILLHAIESAANRHKKHIVPWLSLSVDFYVRVFVRVFESPQEVKRSVLRRSLVYQSVQCPAFFLQPVGAAHSTKRGAVVEAGAAVGTGGGGDLNYYGGVAEAPSVCPETGGKMRIGGPVWSQPLHDQAIVDELLRRFLGAGAGVGAGAGAVESPSQPSSSSSSSASSAAAPAEGTEDYMKFTSTASRLGGILTAISEETKASPDAALYYSLPDLCQAVQCVSPSHVEVHAALQRAGYSYSQFHHDPTAIKTNAPASFMFDLMRAWCVLHPPEGSKHKAQSAAAAAILSRPMTHQVSFEVPDELKLEHNRRRKDALARFPNNPEDNWGPKKRAAGGDKANSNSKKKKKNGE